jgi:hypothetical protein
MLQWQHSCQLATVGSFKLPRPVRSFRSDRPCYQDNGPRATKRTDWKRHDGAERAARSLTFSCIRSVYLPEAAGTPRVQQGLRTWLVTIPHRAMLTSAHFIPSNRFQYPGMARGDSNTGAVVPGPLQVVSLTPPLRAYAARMLQPLRPSRATTSGTVCGIARSAHPVRTRAMRKRKAMGRRGVGRPGTGGRNPIPACNSMIGPLQ